MPEPSNREVLNALDLVLGSEFWPTELSAGITYERRKDDHDGDLDDPIEGKLMVTISPNGDVVVATGLHPRQNLRYRKENGGGHSSRTRKALVALALAIKRDNEASPQQ